MSKRKYEVGYPILLAEADSPSHCRAWCPWCRRWHLHGMDANGDFEGHRAAHCGAGPFKETGYYLISEQTANRLHGHPDKKHAVWLGAYGREEER